MMDYVLLVSFDVLLILFFKLMNPNISSFVPINHIHVFNLWIKTIIISSLSLPTSISFWWQFKLTEKHSKFPSTFATIHQIIAIQCISQHPYIFAVSRVTVESLDVSFCSFILLLFTETKKN